MLRRDFIALRKKLGFRFRTELAAYIGVSPETVKKWERGERRIPTYAVKMLMRIEKRASAKTITV